METKTLTTERSISLNNDNSLNTDDRYSSIIRGSVTKLRERLHNKTMKRKIKRHESAGYKKPDQNSG